jgi:hypothetical protein
MQEFVKTVMKDGRMQGALLVGDTDLGITVFYFKIQIAKITNMIKSCGCCHRRNLARKYGFIGDIL